MLYVMTMRWHDHLSGDERDGALGRRAEWKYPDGLNVIGEYWLASNDPAVVVVFETDASNVMLEIGMTWGDVFEIQISPALSSDEGLRVGPEIMSRIRG
jgi:Protein of unknown function (DUF3303)